MTLSTLGAKRTIKTVAEFMSHLDTDTAGWTIRWFRGQKENWELKPTIFRRKYNENLICHDFRNKAPGYGVDIEFDRFDKWLFQMQHYGAPTRLLDWTESVLVALYFATLDAGSDTEKSKPVVWILNPAEMNNVSVNKKSVLLSMATSQSVCGGYNNCQLAFNAANPRTGSNDNDTNKPLSTINPVAITTTYIDQRLVAQKSVFTIHGSSREPLEKCFGINPSFIFRYEFSEDAAQSIRTELTTMGITHSSIFPDLGGLCKDLKTKYICKDSEATHTVDHCGFKSHLFHA